MKKLQKIISYIVVAALASAVTLLAFGPKSVKLDRLLRYIDRRYIGQVDMAAVEDAAAVEVAEATNPATATAFR